MVRFKNRYITVRIDTKAPITQPLNFNSLDLYNEITNKVKKIHGIFGFSAAKPGLKVNYYNELTRFAIIRARHGPHKLIASVLPLVQSLKGIYCSFKIFYIGATLHHCYKAIKRYHAQEPINIRCEEKNDSSLNIEHLEKVPGSNKNTTFVHT